MTEHLEGVIDSVASDMKKSLADMPDEVIAQMVSFEASAVTIDDKWELTLTLEPFSR